MRVMILLIWCCLMTLSSGYADEKRDELRLSLSHALANITQKVAQLRTALTATDSILPKDFDDVLVVRRTIAADWHKKMNDTTTPVDELAANRFHKEILSLDNDLTKLINAANQINYSKQRFPHCLEESIYKKYIAKLTTYIDVSLQTLVAGKTLEDDRDQYHIQQRYSDILSVIEAQHAIPERYNVIPAESPVLLDYQTHLRVSREKLEAVIVTPDADINSHQISSVSQAFQALLQADVDAIVNIKESGLADTSPAIMSYKSALANYRATLQELLTIARSTNADDDEHYKREQAAYYKEAIYLHLVNIGQRWLDNEIERKNQRKGIKEDQDLFTDEQRKHLITAMKEFDGKRTAHEKALQQALQTENIIAALQQMSALDSFADQEHYIINNAADDAEYEINEKTIKKHEKDPDIAKLLKHYHEQKTAYVKARNDAHDLNLKIREHELTIEIAQLQAELLQYQADLHLDESYRLLNSLEEAAETVRDAIELRTGNEK